MCKAHSKVTHIKQQKYFHHLKRPVYNRSSWNCDAVTHPAIDTDNN